MSMLDRIREKQGNTTFTVRNTQKPNKPQNTTKTTTGSITFACGHIKPLAHVISKVCGACREKAKQDRDRVVREQRLQRKQHKPEIDSGWKRQSSTNLARLPHGSKFDRLIYNSESKAWSGMLTIPGEWLKKNFSDDNGEDLSFFGTEGAVFKLLNVLDSHWRDYLERRCKQASQKAEKVEDINPQPSDSSGELLDSITDCLVVTT